MFSPAAARTTTSSSSRLALSSPEKPALRLHSHVAASSVSFRHEMGLQFPKIYQRTRNGFLIFCSSNSTNNSPTTIGPPVIKKRKRYRKQYPGESQGIVEEMRFVAMKLRNNKGITDGEGGGGGGEDSNPEEELSSPGDGGGTWRPSIEGFLKYLVDSKLVFDTLDRIIDESNHVAYAYFRKTGLERAESLSKDIEWFRQQDIVIPQPSTPGISYAEYLTELAEKSAPLFLCHFYNIYFSHIAGGQVIAKQVSEKLLGGRELEFYRWEGDVPELLKDVRDKLNKLGEHWSRDVKNRCLREAAKSFQFLGQIVRLIIL